MFSTFYSKILCHAIVKNDITIKFLLGNNEETKGCIQRKVMSGIENS